MQRSPESVRPRTSDCTTTMSSGLGGGDECGDSGIVRVSLDDGVFPVGEFEGANNAQELEATVEEEEQVVCPPCLPSPYQPTRSEYLEHCVTHFPFRAWCRHCLESRGREFGHSHAGPKNPQAAAVIAFDYCFLSDAGEILDQEGFEAAGEGAVKV